MFSPNISMNTSCSLPSCQMTGLADDSWHIQSGVASRVTSLTIYGHENICSMMSWDTSNIIDHIWSCPHGQWHPWGDSDPLFITLSICFFVGFEFASVTLNDRSGWWQLIYTKQLGLLGDVTDHIWSMISPVILQSHHSAQGMWQARCVSAGSIFFLSAGQWVVDFMIDGDLYFNQMTR